MAGLVAAGAGLLIVGLFTIIVGLTQADRAGGRAGASQAARLKTAWLSWPRAIRMRAAIGAGSGLLVTLFTGFVPALVLLPALVWVLPELLRDPPQPELELLEGLDRWVRVLAASVGTGKSIGDAIRSSRAQVPARLSGPVVGLITRIDERWTPHDALQQMADEVDSADADAVLAALILVDERGGVGASATLDALSDSLQDRLRAMREISAERAKPQVVVRQVTMITLVALGVSLLVAPDYFAPFGTLIGQLLMLLLGSAYLASLIALRRIATPRHRERILVRATDPEVARV